MQPQRGARHQTIDAVRDGVPTETDEDRVTGVVRRPMHTPDSLVASDRQSCAIAQRASFLRTDRFKPV
jgi:hypothetical protein